MAHTPRKSFSFTSEQVDAMLDALSYWMLASANNFDSGEEDPELARDRSLVNEAIRRFQAWEVDE